MCGNTSLQQSTRINKDQRESTRSWAVGLVMACLRLWVKSSTLLQDGYRPTTKRHVLHQQGFQFCDTRLIERYRKIWEKKKHFELIAIQIIMSWKNTLVTQIGPFVPKDRWKRKQQISEKWCGHLWTSVVLQTSVSGSASQSFLRRPRCLGSPQTSDSKIVKPEKTRWAIPR